MDAVRFDNVARWLASTGSRRGLVAAALALGLSNRFAVARSKHRTGQTEARVHAEGRCRRDGSPCKKAVQCCSRKCSGKKRHKKCKPCAVKTCADDSDVCSGAALCSCEGNRHCSCWTDVDGDPLCASRDYGACVACTDDAGCAAAFGSR